MTQQQTSIVAGVFQDDTQVKEAVNALKGAGFAYDQVGVASRNGGATTASLGNDLMNLGMAPDQATYYEREFNSGHVVVSVRPDGRDEEVKNIFKSNGAYEFGMSTGSAPANAGGQLDNDSQGDSRQQGGQSTDIPGYSQADGANYGQPGGQYNPGGAANREGENA